MVMIVLVASFFNFNAKLVSDGTMFCGLKFCGHNCDWSIKDGMSESSTENKHRMVRSGSGQNFFFLWYSLHKSKNTLMIGCSKISDIPHKCNKYGIVLICGCVDTKFVTKTTCNNVKKKIDFKISAYRKLCTLMFNV